MSHDLEQFDSLKADITLFVAPVMNVKVTDAPSSAVAIDTAKQIKSMLAKVESKRKELVGPLNDRVKFINEYVKKLTSPLTNAESHVRSELNEFARQQELIRQEAERKAEEERIAKEREAEEEYRRQQEALRKQQEEEEQLQREALALFGGDVSEEEQKAAAEKAERERLELEAKREREKMILAAEHEQKKYDAKKQQISNTRKTLKCELIDINLVPKEFLIVTLNEKAVLAAARAGVQIAGVRILEDISVAIGSKTYVPKQMAGE